MSEATKKIFISHRSLDCKIVNELVQYMENVGIEKDEIFYTSADSTGARFELGPEVKKAINEASKALTCVVKKILIYETKFKYPHIILTLNPSIKVSPEAGPNQIKCL